MKHLIALFIFIFTAGSISAVTADEILKAAADKYQKTTSISADYTFSSQSEQSKGSIISSGDKFYIYSSDLSTWYDGRTQWTYSPATNEVNISEPTPEELQQVNPFAIIKAFRKAYKSSLLKSQNGTYTIQLLPIDRYASIRKAVVTMDAQSYYPTKIVLSLDNGMQATIGVKNVKTGVNYPRSTFVFSKSKYPHAEIIDLR